MFIRAILILLLSCGVAFAGRTGEQQAGLKKNIASYGACNGSDDSVIFGNFHTDAAAWHVAHPTDIIELTIPYGWVCRPQTNFTFDTSKIRIIMYGATIQGVLQLGINGGYPPDNNAATYLQTTTKGTNTVQLVTNSDSSNFNVGDPVIVSGYEQAGNGYEGYPPSFAFWEYNHITAMTGCPSGTCVFTLKEPLLYSYKSTWPTLSPNKWQGGPAMIMPMGVDWDQADVQWLGGTINLDGQTSNVAGAITFRNQTWIGGATPFCSTMKVCNLLNVTSDVHTMELDKIVDQTVVQGGHNLGFQVQTGGSAKLLSICCGAYVETLNGTATKTVVQSSTVNWWKFGANSFGASTYQECHDSTVNTITTNSVFVDNINTLPLSSGVVAVPRTLGFFTLGTPGTNSFLSGRADNEGYPFRTTDAWADGGESFATITMSNGSGDLQTSVALFSAADATNHRPIMVYDARAVPTFPTLVTTIATFISPTHVTLTAPATDNAAGIPGAVIWGTTYWQTTLSGSSWAPVEGLNVRGYAHPAPQMNFTNCIGTDRVAENYSQAGAQGVPFGGYFKRTYVNASGSDPNAVGLWGYVTSYSINVTTPTSGASNFWGTLFDPGTGVTDTSDSSFQRWNPKVDSQISVNRLMTCTLSLCSATGVQGSDQNIPTPVGHIYWLASSVAPYAELSGGATVTVEAIMNQQVVVSPQ